jgi:hypothetical protein
MFRDPIVVEIQQIRYEIEQACQNNSEVYYGYLLETQKKYADRLVRRQPKPALRPSTLLPNTSVAR